MENVPNSSALKVLQYKSPLAHCQYECVKGCSIHEKKGYPKGCHDIICPYLLDEDIHRPDIFAQCLEELKGNLGGYIPSIPTVVPVQEAIELIIKSRTILVGRIIDKQWKRLVMPLDLDSNGVWYPEEKLLPPWTELLTKYKLGLIQRSAAPIWGAPKRH